MVAEASILRKGGTSPIEGIKRMNSQMCISGPTRGLLNYLAFISSTIASLCLFGLTSALPSAAEMVQTSPGVLQSSDLRAKVIISHRTPGIFFALTEPIELQLFDPSKLLQEGSGNKDSAGTEGALIKPYHVFIEYNPELDRYNAVHVGGQTYRIKGGFSLVSAANSHPEEFPRFRITVDNNNPYLSLVYESSAQAAPEIIGFRGTQLVVKKTGQRYAALLEANQFNQLKGLIEPYTLDTDKITFKGNAFEGSALGVELEPSRNACLDTGATFLSQEAASTLRSKGDRGQALKELEALLKTGASQDPFKGVLLLRIEPQEIIGLDYKKDRVIVVRTLPRASQNVCMIEEVRLG